MTSTIELTELEYRNLLEKNAILLGENSHMKEEVSRFSRRQNDFIIIIGLLALCLFSLLLFNIKRYSKQEYNSAIKISYYDGFDEGVSSGYSEGYDDGYDDGFFEGQHEGNSEAYDDGYHAGYHEASEKYSSIFS